MSLHKYSHPHNYWRVLLLLVALLMVLAYNNQINLPHVLGISTDSFDWGYIK